MELVEERSDDIINECLGEENIDKNEKDHIRVDDTTVTKQGKMPKLGMVFGSRDEAFLFYKAYGYHMGFGVIRRSKHDFHGNPLSITLTCSMGGKPRVKSSSRKTRLKPISKTECPAMMFVKDRYLQNQWTVEGLELNHNHELIPDMVRFMKCFHELPVSVQKQLEINDKAGIPLHKAIGSPVRAHQNCSLSQKDCRNHVNKTRRLNLGKGDAEALKEYFHHMHAQDPNFYYSTDVDDEGCLRNVFWADARSRAAYQYFGDVISFDTSYLTNKYAMPLAPFVGVNHHGQSILLGCGLLADETTEAYIWLFTRLLACMNGKAPNAIITDQCRAIRGGVETVFTHARHRFCLWYIMKKFPEKLGRYKQRESISFMLSEAIYDSLSVLQFENTWKETIEKHILKTNDWLASLYQDRERWVPIYVKNTFWAGMSTTQRSESIDVFFDGYVTPKTSLKQFLEQYGNALRSKYEKEAEEDFRSFHMEPKLLSPLKLEKQVAKVYTINMFMKFQAEVKEMISLNIVRVGKHGPAVTYQVTELAQDSHIDYRVVYNTAEQEVWCICRSFQFRGILCRHALCVLRQELIMELPSKYILDRWRKNFKQLHDFASSTHVVPMREIRLYDELYIRGQQYIADIVELGSTNQETNEFALKVLTEAKDKVVKFDELCRVQEITNNKQSITLASNSIDINLGFENSMRLPSQLLSPSPTHPKCHPPANILVGKREKGITKRKKALQKGRDATVQKDKSLANKSKMICIDVQASQFDDTCLTTPIGTQESFMSLVQPIQFNETHIVAPIDTQESSTPPE